MNANMPSWYLNSLQIPTRLRRGTYEELLKDRELAMVSDPELQKRDNTFAKGYVSIATDIPAIIVGLGTYDKIAKFVGTFETLGEVPDA